MKHKMVTDEKDLLEIIKHIDAAATLMGASFKLLLDADDPEVVVGFVVGPEEMFAGELDVIEEDGTWTPPEKPSDPKQLN